MCQRISDVYRVARYVGAAWEREYLVGAQMTTDWLLSTQRSTVFCQGSRRKPWLNLDSGGRLQIDGKQGNRGRRVGGEEEERTR